jgi:hypothetical protein
MIGFRLHVEMQSEAFDPHTNYFFAAKERLTALSGS